MSGTGMFWYNGREIYAFQPEATRTCEICGMYVWFSHVILGRCPLCWVKSNPFMLEISFCKLKVEKWRTILKRAKEISTYENYDNYLHMIRFNNISELSENRHALKNFFEVVPTYNSKVTVTLNGMDIYASHAVLICREIDAMCKKAGAKDVAFEDGEPILHFQGVIL